MQPLLSFFLEGRHTKRVFTTRTLGSFGDVLNAISESYGMTPNEILQKTRQSGVVEPRQIAMYILKTYYRLSLSDIGHLLGGFHHTTVLSGCRTVENLMDTEPEYKKRVAEIAAKLNC